MLCPQAGHSAGVSPQQCCVSAGACEWGKAEEAEESSAAWGVKTEAPGPTKCIVWLHIAVCNQPITITAQATETYTRLLKRTQTSIPSASNRTWEIPGNDNTDAHHQQLQALGKERERNEETFHVYAMVISFNIHEPCGLFLSIYAYQRY